MKRHLLGLLMLLSVSVFLKAQSTVPVQPSVQEIMNADGSVRLDRDGGYSVDGYELQLDANGQPRLTPKGNAQTQSASGIWNTLGTGPGNGVNSNVLALAVYNGELYVGGNFNGLTGGASANFIARWSGSSWNSVGTGASNGVGGTNVNFLFTSVNALAVYNGELYVGGNFASAGGASAKSIARWNGSSWNSVGTGSGNGVNGVVNALTVYNGELYVGGSFSVAGGAIQDNIARWSGASWIAVPTGSGPSGLNGPVNALAVYNGELYVGGDFTVVNGLSANRIARWNGNGWNRLGAGSSNGVNGQVNVLAVYNSELYVGGLFTGASGTSANNIARWNGNSWNSVGTGSGNGVNSFVNALTVYNGELYVGGVFVSAGGANANRIARWNGNGWNTLGTGPGNGVGNTVLALAVYNSELYVGGIFTSAGGANANRIARWSIILTPIVTTLSATNINSASASLNGTINPNGFPLTLAQFEYSLDSTFTTGVQNASTTPSTGGIGSGTSPVSVSATISIQANSTYYFRLRATNANGTGVSQRASFTNISPPFPNTGLELWLRADSAVTQISGLVSQWGDLSSNNRTAISSGAARPDFVSSYSPMGGRPVMGFGTFGSRSFGFPRITNIRTVFVVAENQNPTALQFLLGDSTSFDFHGGTSNSALFDNSFASPAILQGRLLYNGNPVLITSSAAARPTTPTIITLQTTGNVRASTLSFDRPPLGTATMNRSWNGLIAEVLIFSDSLNLTQRIAVENYLASRYGIGQNNVSNPTIAASLGGTFVLGSTGATVTFTTASTTTGSLSGSVTNSRPNVVGTLPAGITNIAERFWTINQTNLTGFNCAVTFDLSTLGGIQNFNTLKVLRRNNASSPWIDVETLPGVTITRHAPFITVAGITSFSDFTIGGGNDNQLPVELAEFTGRKAEQGVELLWRTASELNNAGFEVERKSQGATWNTLGFVRGAGTTTEAQSYSFIDRTATGKVQYRLKQIDFDGQFEYSNVIEVDAGLPKTFALEQNYPNPFNPTTIINYQLPTASTVSLKIYDVLGKEVATLVNARQEAGSYNFTFNASNLASGIYFYRLQAGSFVQTKKMMLVK